MDAAAGRTAPVPLDSLPSPFAKALAGHAAELPPAFREQFLLAPEDQHAMLFEGCMDRVWHRPAWLWPVFWLLTRPNILFPETGADVPATMTIVAGRDGHGQSHQRWDRTFAFRTPRRFDAIMGYDSERGQIVELFGRRELLEIAWDVRFHPPDTMEIVTHRVALRLGCRRLPIPRSFCVSVRAVERAVRDDMITIKLRLTAPLLGTIFGYSGAFRLRRIFRPQKEN
jgi:hypothetical protein